jgi:hypothetical protein
MGSKSSGNAVTDGAGGAEEGDLGHGLMLMMVVTSDRLLVAGNCCVLRPPTTDNWQPATESLAAFVP